MTELTFYNWLRSVSGTPQTSAALGRAQLGLTITVAAEVSGAQIGSPIDSTTLVQFPGPGDVQALAPAAVTRVFPTNGSANVEPDLFPYVELAAPDLPWRYSPGTADPVSWLAVIAGTEGTDLSLSADGHSVQLSDGYLSAVIRSSSVGAHVQTSDGTPTLGRVVGPRLLTPSSACLAVLVPRFAPNGSDWPAGTASLPAYYSWRFSTGDGETFLSISRRLRHRDVPGLGTANLALPFAGNEELPLHAALRPLGASPLSDPTAAVQQATLELSTGPVTSPARPEVRAPDYTAAWTDAAGTPYANQLATDPRDRVAAGLGAADGIEYQEQLVSAVLAQAGDYHLSAARLAALSGGAQASASSWRTRIPADVFARLAVLGPALRALPLGSGAMAGNTVTQAISGIDRVPVGALSSAALRLTRSGRASRRAPNRGSVIDAAMTRPLHEDLELFDRGVYDDPKVADLLRRIQGPVWEESSEPAAPLERVIDAEHLRKIADEVSEWIDPTGPRAPQRLRVLDTIAGLDPAEADAPLEVCESLDIPTWTYLREQHPEFLLHGVTDIPTDTVLAMMVDDRFVDGYLAGINSQLLAELRFRNVAIVTDCTPLRRFWSKVSATGGALDEVDDILGLANWGQDTPLGDDQHGPSAARQLVLLFRTILFQRYPATAVSVRRTPEEARIWPSFGGSITADVSFFGFDVTVPEGGSLNDFQLVLEDPPHGIRFRRLVDPGPAGSAGWAAKNLDPPVQVIISGDYLDGEL